MTEAARRAAEAAARDAYGRLVALLAARTRDLAAAEDALAEAFRAALETWPVRGVPDRPAAWLLTVARRGLGRAARHGRVRDAALPALDWLAREAEEPAAEIPDRRLALLFVCAHPAIDPAARTPLMLQVVLGLDAPRIAAAFLASPSAMAQRLVRAKLRIRDAGIRFAEPEPRELPERLEAVLAAVYAAYGTAWDAAPGAEDRGGLAEEAIHLARLLAALLPGEPEALGLLALLLHCEARRAARRGPDGGFVPLGDQDTALWSAPMIAEAEAALTAASRAGRLGRFQLEASVQSVHAARARSGRTDHGALVLLYDLLAREAPTPGLLVARAAALGEAAGPEAGLAALDAAEVVAYQPWWAARAHLLRRAGRAADAAEAYRRAIGLAEDPALRAWLARQAGLPG